MASQKVLHIYCRVSSDVQLQGYSLQAQELAGIEKAKQLGFGYQLYVDGGKSAKDEDISNRPALTELVRLVDAGQVTDIYVTEGDRLTRSPELHFKLKMKFIRHSVIIHTSSGSIDYSNHDQEFMADLKALLAKKENSDKSTRSVRAMREAAKKGKWMGVMIPYGYRKDENRIMSIDNLEAQVYRQMVAWSLAGDGTNTIAKKLNALNVETRAKKFFLKGTKVVKRFTKSVRHVTNEEFVWRAGTIYCMLTNPIYKGERKYKNEIIAAPKIIDDKTWERVQLQLKKNRNCAFNHGVHEYLLKGLLRCGVCGANLYGKIKSNERTYMCSSKRYKSCGLRSPNLDRLESIVWDRVINSGEYLCQIQYEWNEHGNDDAIKTSDKDIAGFKSELELLDGRAQKLFELYELGRIDIENFDSRKTAIEKEKKVLLNKLKNEEQRALALAQIKNQTEDLFAGLKGLWNVRKELDKMGFKEKRDLLHQLGTNIIVTWNAEDRTHNIDLTFSVNGFNYQKKAKILPKGKKSEESKPTAFWSGAEVEFFSKLFRREVNYESQLHIEGHAQ